MVNNTQQTNQNVRPPVVVVLGHVDHGKTKLLSTIRNVAMPKEPGNITQLIGAYQVEVPQAPKSAEALREGGLSPKVITFLDTPGHEAFTAIRSRGAKVADVAVLVVAADESVKPQTKEAIKIIKEQGIPFVVALNKIDKEGANPQRVKQDLATEEVLVEDWGGKVPVVEISAKEAKNIPELLDMILLLAELEDLKEDISLPAQGVIIESNLDKRRGYVATGLIEKGIVKIGDWIVAGTIVGKVKSLQDFKGKPISEARPSQPVQITGWSSSPEIGRKFIAAYSKDEALEIQAENIDLTPLINFFKSNKEEILPDKKILNIIFKSDVFSSLEALDGVLGNIKSQEVGYKVVNYDIGNISEGDVKTAIASNAQIIGFRIGTEESVRKLAERENVKINTFDVIYNLVEYVRSEMAGLLEPEIRRTQLGKLRVLALFKKDAKSQIVGGKVVSGKIIRGSVVDVIRGQNKIGFGKLGQLQHNKEDMSEVKEGLEAGLRVDFGKDGVEIKEGDMLEVYEEEKIARTL